MFVSYRDQRKKTYAWLLHTHGGCVPLIDVQVFDGHGGVDAASFIKKTLLNFIIEDSQFPSSIKKAVKSAFVKADHAFRDACSLDNSSGTTALIALVLGR
jgi:protein phosphatase 2C family protein 2/3